MTEQTYMDITEFLKDGGHEEFDDVYQEEYEILLDLPLILHIWSNEDE